MLIALYCLPVILGGTFLASGLLKLRHPDDLPASADLRLP